MFYDIVSINEITFRFNKLNIYFKTIIVIALNIGISSFFSIRSCVTNK